MGASHKIYKERIWVMLYPKRKKLINKQIFIFIF